MLTACWISCLASAFMSSVENSGLSGGVSCPARGTDGGGNSSACWQPVGYHFWNLLSCRRLKTPVYQEELRVQREALMAEAKRQAEELAEAALIREREFQEVC